MWIFLATRKHTGDPELDYKEMGLFAHRLLMLRDKVLQYQTISLFSLRKNNICSFFPSDGIARVFTTSEERFASEEELKVSLLLVGCFQFRVLVKEH